jgi:hypothetical protein
MAWPSRSGFHAALELVELTVLPGAAGGILVP